MQFADESSSIVTRLARAVLRIQNCVIKKNAGAEFRTRKSQVPPGKHV
jgi:hypothetical protein